MPTSPATNVVTLKTLKHDRRINLTKAVIDKLPYAQRDSEGRVKQRIYWDKKTPGFGLVVGLKTKTFVVQRDVNGRSTRITLDKASAITPAQALKRAKEELVAMGQGINPNDQKREARAKKVTLREALKSYKETRKNLSEKTRTEYTRLLERYLGDWLDKPLTDITPDKVAKQHSKIAEQVRKTPRFQSSKNYSGASKATGQSAANDAFRAVRTIYNHALANNPALPSNPVQLLSSTRAWFPENRRTGHIKTAELGPWLRAISSYPNDVQRDYALVVLFTGLRRNEAATLEWRSVDLEAGVLHIPITKNKRPLSLPLSNYLTALFTARKARCEDSPWVFPAASASGHIEEPRSALDWAAKECGVAVTVHDLRRTFVTIAEGCEVPHYVFKGLVNHSTAGDVTGSHYVQMSAERMRPWMQRITDEILKHFAGCA